MFCYKGQAVQTHDLLRVNPECLLREIASRGEKVPGWAEEGLRRVPFVVIRRGLASESCLPIGIRGAERDQRWATTCSADAVVEVIAPSQLSGRGCGQLRAEMVPVLQSLEFLEAQWDDFNCPWGPAGSVGFELATGAEVVRAGSDLDIVIRAAEPIPMEKATLLCAQATNLPSVVDIRMETPMCGFSLREYAREGGGAILLRMPTGAVLGNDPWSGREDPTCGTLR